MAKLCMQLFAEFSANELFDLEQVQVKEGRIRPSRLPRSLLFVRHDPGAKQDIIIFIGESQPPSGKYTFGKRLIEFARKLNVQRVFTFAAMTTKMHPKDDSRVFGVAVDDASLDEPGKWSRFHGQSSLLE